MNGIFKFCLLLIGLCTFASVFAEPGSSGVISCEVRAYVQESQNLLRGPQGYYLPVDELKANYLISPSYDEAMERHYGMDSEPWTVRSEFGIKSKKNESGVWFPVLSSDNRHRVEYTVESIQMTKNDPEDVRASSPGAPIYEGGRSVEISLTVDGAVSSSQAVVLNGGTIEIGTEVEPAGFFNYKLRSVFLKCRLLAGKDS